MNLAVDVIDPRNGNETGLASSLGIIDVLVAGAMSIADIDKLMEELKTKGDYLQSEGERVRQLTARYAQLAQTASASVKIFAETLGKWRNPETVNEAPAATPRILAPAHDGELQDESNDQ
jgi:hypothetical protein